MEIILPNNNSTLESFKTFSEVDCIVSDIDGTLTVGSTPILQQIRKKTNNLMKKNVTTSIATGRPYRGAYTVIQELGIPIGTPIILYNGAVLLEYGTEDLIIKNTISTYDTSKIYDLVAECGAGIYIYTCDAVIPSVYNLLESHKLEEMVYYAGKKKRLVDINGFLVTPFNGEIIKQKSIVSILIKRNELPIYVYKRIMNYLESSSQISYTDSGSGFIEICATKARKGNVIDILKNQCYYRGKKKILAIGDNDNDVDLFKKADISIAVKNASNMAKKVCNYVCERDSAAGYLDMLTVIEQAKRYY